MSQGFLDYYRCPASFGNFVVAPDLSDKPEFFRFGADVLCYGSYSANSAALVGTSVYDALPNVASEGTSVRLPFDPSEIVENLRRERYVSNPHNGHRQISHRGILGKAYRHLRPALPVAVRKHLQRLYLRDWERLSFPKWPVDRTVDSIFANLLRLALRSHTEIPFIWFWPDGARSCAILTHDVETLAGRDFCSQLMDLDDSVGIKSAFQIVPETRYPVPRNFLDSLRERGFEVNVHDLTHDGQLFATRETFLHLADRINEYGKEFGAIGFRSGVLYRNADWLHALDFAYDMSVPNVGHLEPQRGGCCTVLPFFIDHLLELPVTTTQDYSLFHILKNYSIDLWKRQLSLIGEQHGMASFIVHPDYVIERRARATYQALLAYLARCRSDSGLWIALPREVNDWWRARHQMELVADGERWHITGDGKERARVAFASLDGDRLVFTIEQPNMSRALEMA